MHSLLYILTDFICLSTHSVTLAWAFLPCFLTEIAMGPEGGKS
jgi:hypothetical protein